MRNVDRSNSHSLRVFGAVSTLALAAALAPLHNVSASTFTILYSFCSQANCADGGSPQARLLIDSAGNLYGTTGGFGGGNSGTVFEMAKAGSTYTHQALYNFCAQANCTDGFAPNSHLIMDVNGNLYGTTSYGGSGSDSDGTVFKLHPNRKRTKWTLTTLHSFCSTEGCADGDSPSFGLTYVGAESGALYDGRSPLYGTTQTGGSANLGVAFQLRGGRHTYGVIYNFCSQPNCSDGAFPEELIADSNGNLFGQGGGGGANNEGVVFELSPAKRTFSESILYSFCQLSACEDGSSPFSALTFGANGILLGTTEEGGSEGYGTIIKLTPNGSVWQETRLYNFAGAGLDGAYPNDKLLLDANGNLFGTTGSYYNGPGGTVFELSGTTLTALHGFCADGTCISDGNRPVGVISDAVGNLFGVVTFGGPNDGGLVYELSP